MRRLSRRLRPLGLGALIALALAPGAQAACRDPGARMMFAEGGYFQPPSPLKPEHLSFLRADGTSGSLEDYRGKSVMLLFWATWCGGCMAELPAVDALMKDYEGTDLVILPVSIDEALDPKSAQQALTWYRGENPDAPAEHEIRSPAEEAEFLRKAVRWFLDLQGWENIPAHVDYGRSLFDTLCQAGTPAHVILNPQGEAVEIFVGAQPWDKPRGRAYLDRLAGKAASVQ